MLSTGTAPLTSTAGRSRALLDGAVAAAVLVATLAQLTHGGIGPVRPGAFLDAAHHRSGLDLTGLALATASVAPLLARRRSPLVVFMVSAGATVLLTGLGAGLNLALAPAVALHRLAADRTPHAPWTRRTSLTVVGLFAAYVVVTAAAQGRFPASALLHSGMTWSAAWFAGERARLRREHVATLRERAHRVEREAERDRRLAAAEERARIARDLHDSAGHAVNVIAVRAGAARLRHDRDPGSALPALQAIEELARQTAAEIDQIVGTLRRSSPPDGPVEAPPGLAPPGLASLDTLVSHHAAAGLELALDASGHPRPLGGPADQGAYRILQEALTNAARHGAGRAHVGLAWGDTALDLTVTNPVPGPRAATPTRPGDRGGHGLVGMRERATLLGGDLTAGCRDGTFRVHARIPYDGRRP